LHTYILSRTRIITWLRTRSRLTSMSWWLSLNFNFWSPYWKAPKSWLRLCTFLFFFFSLLLYINLSIRNCCLNSHSFFTLPSHASTSLNSTSLLIINFFVIWLYILYDLHVTISYENTFLTSTVKFSSSLFRHMIICHTSKHPYIALNTTQSFLWPFISYTLCGRPV